MSLEQILRYVTLFLLAFWDLFLEIKARQANRQKPKTKYSNISKIIVYGLVFCIPLLLLVLELLGLKLLPLPDSRLIQITGFFFVLLGFVLRFVSMITLASNWTSSGYQINKRRRLVKEGIYSLVRHPIYTSLIMIYTGAFLVAQSYFFIAMFVLLATQLYFRGKSEERLLTSLFKGEYIKYKKRTKMFIPFLF